VVLAGFDVLENAGRGVLAILKSGAQPSAMEVIDRSALAAARQYMPEAGLPDHEAVLLIECDGSPGAVEEGTQRVAEAVRELAVDVQRSTDPVESEQLWQARRVLGAASIRMRPNVSRVFDGEDIGVPMTAVPEALRRAREITQEHDLAAAIYGHIGDGNLHVAMVADLQDPDKMEAAEQAAHEIQQAGIELDGTSTAEHGVGIARAKYMPEEHGPALGIMRAIKQKLDPNNLMNPGKLAL
jgi:glycolate oxidase